MTRVPSRGEMAWPTLVVMQSLGGSASNREIAEGVARFMEIPDQVLEIPHRSRSGSRQSEFEYQLGWTRTYLHTMSAIANSGRAVWSVTEIGRRLLGQKEPSARAQIQEHVRSYLAGLRNRASGMQDEPVDEQAGDSWQDALLSAMKDLTPDAFERLCQRVLRESGFTQVAVTGRTGDGGIDGVGVLRLNLISFQVVFQCKRYEGAVGAGMIRDFRGAMVGRAEKGLFLTTGRFSPSAQREAVRDGAPAIDLLDGQELCGILAKLNLGVQSQMVQSLTIDQQFFSQI